MSCSELSRLKALELLGGDELFELRTTEETAQTSATIISYIQANTQG